MATFLYRLGRLAFRRRRLFLTLWIAVLATVGIGAASVSGTTTDDFTLPGTQSQKAIDLLEKEFPKGSADGAAARVVGIRAVAVGDSVISPGLTRKLIDAFTKSRPGHTPEQDRQLARLTEREREVLTGVATGWTNTEIAERLCLAESTVKSHVSRILTKIGARDRVQVVIFAYDVGLVRPA
ncbi:two-component regulator [Streptomyces bingchenggensis BCW-1]|uniref:Two-component regulator n=1 Tax=Streptomyces bingchenggensis (strain BCW-1) TaxID=749414 RepID=D7BPT4_STRBB|nr:MULTISPECIES: response regulator transcription factor [Streptomyces]ADI04941.1 two-component regulator [Streptomyces bingchenggensis BCW-1]